MSTKVTIDKIRHDIVARTEWGTVVARKSTNCNPAALRQLICEVEMVGHTIDWDESQVANPDSAKALGH